MEELNDYELLEYINSNNEEAYDLMFKKYKPLIVNISKKYKQLALKYGYEINDLIQEGMLGLNSAIETFDDSLNTKFYTLARVCIERRIINLFKIANREKYKILNESIPIENENYDIENIIGDTKSEPLNIMIESQEKDNIYKGSYNRLSDYEKEVLEYKLQGFSNKEIALKLNKTIKQIDNTIQRIKKKYKNNN